MAVPSASPMVQRAYEACADLARSHYENFPVASRLLPPEMRPGVAAVYAFARRADDFADEPRYADVDRLRLLDEWEARLASAVAGRPAGTDPDDLIFVALADAIERHDLPPALFSALLSAFRQDVTVKRYETWSDVLDYCSRSANPVGRLVLRIGGYRDERLDRSSDALCTALQLTNFWQDFATDWRNGRLYVPGGDVRRFGASEYDLDRCIAAAGDAGAATTLPAAWKAVLSEVADRTRALYEEGREVCSGVRGRLRYELRLTWHGGARILERLRRSGYDALHRPTLSARDAGPLVWRAALWSRQ